MEFGDLGLKLHDLFENRTELSNKGISSIVITLSTHSKFCISFFKLLSTFIDLLDVIISFGE